MDSSGGNSKEERKTGNAAMREKNQQSSRQGTAPSNLGSAVQANSLPNQAQANQMSSQLQQRSQENQENSEGSSNSRSDELKNQRRLQLQCINQLSQEIDQLVPDSQGGFVANQKDISDQHLQDKLQSFEEFQADFNKALDKLKDILNGYKNSIASSKTLKRDIQSSVKPILGQGQGQRQGQSQSHRQIQSEGQSQSQTQVQTQSQAQLPNQDQDQDQNQHQVDVQAQAQDQVQLQENQRAQLDAQIAVQAQLIEMQAALENVAQAPLSDKHSVQAQVNQLQADLQIVAESQAEDQVIVQANVGDVQIALQVVAEADKKLLSEEKQGVSEQIQSEALLEQETQVEAQAQAQAQAQIQHQLQEDDRSGLVALAVIQFAAAYSQQKQNQEQQSLLKKRKGRPLEEEKTIGCQKNQGSRLQKRAKLGDHDGYQDSQGEVAKQSSSYSSSAQKGDPSSMEDEDVYEDEEEQEEEEEEEQEEEEEEQEEEEEEEQKKVEEDQNEDEEKNEERRLSGRETLTILQSSKCGRETFVKALKQLPLQSFHDLNSGYTFKATPSKREAGKMLSSSFSSGQRSLSLKDFVTELQEKIFRLESLQDWLKGIQLSCGFTDLRLAFLDESRITLVSRDQLISNSFSIRVLLIPFKSKSQQGTELLTQMLVNHELDDDNQFLLEEDSLDKNGFHYMLICQAWIMKGTK